MPLATADTRKDANREKPEMEEEVVEGVTPDSPPAVVPPAAPSAGSQNTGLPAEPQQPLHLHPRFQEVTRQNRESRARLDQLSQENRQLQQQMKALQQTATGPAYTQVEREERAKARQIIKELMNEDPDYVKEREELAQIRAAFPHLLKGYQGVQSLTQGQQEANVRQGRQAIAEVTKKAIPDNPKAAEHVEDLVTGFLYRNEELLQRFKAGDQTAIQEAFDAVNTNFLSQLRRQANVQLADAKQQTRRLPPRPGGGLPTAPAPPKLEEGKEREYMRALSEASQKVLGGG